MREQKFTQCDCHLTFTTVCVVKDSSFKCLTGVCGSSVKSSPGISLI